MPSLGLTDAERDRGLRRKKTSMGNQQCQTRTLQENEISSPAEGAARSDPGRRLYTRAGNLLDGSLEGGCRVMFVDRLCLGLGREEKKKRKTAPRRSGGVIHTDVGFKGDVKKCVKMKSRRNKKKKHSAWLIFLINTLAFSSEWCSGAFRVLVCPAFSPPSLYALVEHISFRY